MQGIKTATRVSPGVGKEKYRPTYFNKKLIGLSRMRADGLKSGESVYFSENSGKRVKQVFWAWRG